MKESQQKDVIRCREILDEKYIQWEEKKMFGGVCFMVEDKMCFGTYKQALIMRIDPDRKDFLLKKKGASLMKMGERTMSGFIEVLPSAYRTKRMLSFWIQECLDFNPKAKSSKKKKKKKK